MDFNLTEERAMLRDTLRRFLADKYSHENRRALIASSEPYDAEIYAELAELGVLGAMFREDQDGFGGEGFDLMVVFEEVGRAGVIEPVLPAVLAGGLIAALGNDRQRELVDEIIAGTHVAALAQGEAGARYDLNHVETTAVADGDAIVLNGIKTHVLYGAGAQTLVASARETGAAADMAGISLFLVPVNTPGVTVNGHRNMDGIPSATVTLDGVRLTDAARLGAAGEGLDALEAAVARGLTAICAEALGAMEAAKDLTISYLKERKQFGMPIGKFQALQHRMADMLIEVEQARSAVINLAGNLDQPRDVRKIHASAAKNLIGRAGALVAEECIQMHGGIGMTDEYALSHFARRLTMIDHLFGDSDYHLERFIALKAG
ncbi:MULTISPECIES: acyl-CoA dehydrogenase family protein [unclassified Leisingera]|uniref:acyl-CoA dehydrogenase family protein n=1 Tax=unclassified Leisingera TaxID=2614906 RepID=UPI0003096836|nr:MULTISPECIES: acyl-CoA dehydrogenase [unclassified Leisingera]KIC14555.1 acyl-CoA dehydrogenase [Leisingera sp. ANG-DT]KIC24044.1 acyl-CoA dehydrogenase [Leisingera sp. ANG-S3]KIC52530.1 acyl-CoA dehydrogenase [Leisingera sp. ANG-S]KID09832.1 acyl-CoA dehydrogenase [Leisingera sp. ANG1]